MSTNYIQYINLEDPVNYQQIYASQLYGTFFIVFAKFDCDTIVNNGTKKYKMNSIDFELVNYKGIINLGISNVQPPTDYLTQVQVPHFHLMKIEVQALKNEPFPPLNLGGFEVESEDVLHVQRTLKGLNDIQGPLSAEGIFDEEFWYRESKDPNSFQEKKPEPLREISDFSVYNHANLSGIQCPRSTNIIV